MISVIAIWVFKWIDFTTQITDDDDDMMMMMQFYLPSQVFDKSRTLCSPLGEAPDSISMSSDDDDENGSI